MRKFIALLAVSALMLCCFTGCSSASRLKIEAYEWELARVIVLENETAVVVASNNEAEISDTAEKISVTLVAKAGSITVTDNNNSKIYSGTYKRTGTTPLGTDYNIMIDGRTGHATVAMTTYADGTQIPTLPISLGEYTLQLYAK